MTRVLRIVWLPGSDRLEGTCHCGAVRVDVGPVALWEWLLAHPVGHTPDPASVPNALVLATTGR